MRRTLVLCLSILGCSTAAVGHDIPSARVDRSIQAILEAGHLRVRYEVSLAELTLTQDLRQLIGELPGVDRRGWFEEYGRVTGPLNARGLLVEVDGREVELNPGGVDLAIEGHPRFTFHFDTPVPSKGRLRLIDTNYASSEGTSRLAIRGVDGVSIWGDSLPADVEQVPIRPVWQLTDAEERRTKRLVVDYSSEATAALTPLPPPIPPATRRDTVPDGLSRLLDRAGGRAWPALLLAAFLLGAAHAIQPGHGKTIVAASSLGPGSGPFRGALLGLATAIVHLGSVALIAAVLWASRAARPGDIHLALGRSAGFAVAAIGFWRLGRHLAGFGEHDARDGHGTGGHRGLVSLALAGGIVPCWDAVALVLLSEAIGRLALGLTLLAAFCLGMASVLVAVGAASSRLRAAFDRLEQRRRWERRFGILGGVVLAGFGLSMLGN